MRDRFCQLGSCSWRKTPKRCSADRTPEDFVSIDDDDVIILDFPESLKQKPKSSSVSRRSSRFPLLGVISIDDDDDIYDDVDNYVDDGDDNDDVINLQHPVAGVRGAGGDNLDSDASNKSVPLQRSPEFDDAVECQVILEECPAFRFSKCKQTLSKKAPARNRFGLGSESEVGSSESDYSDCEVLEGSFGEVREQWEKAFLRKKSDVSKVGSRFYEEASPSEPKSDIHRSVGVENTTEEHADICFGFASTSVGLNEKFDGGSVNGLKRSSTIATEDSRHHAKSGVMDKEQDIAEEHSDSSQNCKMNNNHREGQSLPESRQPGGTQVHDKGSNSLPTTGEDILKKPECQTDFKGSEEKCFGEPTASVPQTCTKDGEETGINTSTKMARSDLMETVTDRATSTGGHAQGVDSTPSSSNVINDREKLKETDEYKKAIEAEWESRQQQLRIQAEEVQRLRKRRKLESMRRLDMERRQKLRVEEMRETRKKDEESINLKEQLRVEVRKELSKLETTCIDMASLLRCLGIPVQGGLNPASHEVQAAYKRAALKFHPDRASGAAIRQQVEAEEKFKLISRMKEKFLSAACR